VILALAASLSVMAALVSGCAAAPSFAVSERIRSTWIYPEAYAGPDEVVIPLSRGQDDKLYLPVTINGRNIDVVLDTGSRTVFDLKILHALGVETYLTRDNYYGFGGHLRAHAAFLDEIGLGGLKLVGKSVTVIDLSDLQRRQGAGAFPHIDGLIGSDLLAPLSARIDYQALTLTLRRPPLPER
jgi:predicted aspartyl protease